MMTRRLLTHCILIAGLVLSVVIVPPSAGESPYTPGNVASPDVEVAFREAIEMWAYREFWRLWDVSTGESRFYYTQDEFATLMERGNTRPAAGRQVEDLRISVTSPQSALVVARIGLEDPRTNTTQSIIRSFLFYYQDGRWRPQLSDFLGLASYAYPYQPLYGPLILTPPCCKVPVFSIKPKK